MRRFPWRLADKPPTRPPASGGGATAAQAGRPVVGLAPGQSIEDAVAAFEAAQAAQATVEAAVVRPAPAGPPITSALRAATPGMPATSGMGAAPGMRAAPAMPSAPGAAAIQLQPAPALPGMARPGPAPAVDRTPPSDRTPPRTKGRRRALGCLLVLLTMLIGVLALFSAWYLVNRKPVTEFLPPIGVERVPHLLFSVYGVSKPMGVAATPSGDRVYVTESAGESVVRIFDRAGRSVGALRPPADGLPHAPVYLAVAPGGDVYVTDRATGAIYVYDANGAYLRAFTPKVAIPIWQPLGIAFAPNGDLWVTDLSAPFHRLEVFGLDGTLKQTIGTKGSFDFPNAIGFDGAGNAYVSDSNNGRVLVLDPTGAEVSSLNRGIGADIGLPRGTALDDAGRLYVVDATAQTVHVYRTDTSGDGRPRFVADIGTEGTGDGEFEYPNGVATDRRARIYVTDRENDRVQVWGY